jgi:hypothetical protein
LPLKRSLIQSFAKLHPNDRLERKQSISKNSFVTSARTSIVPEKKAVKRHNRKKTTTIIFGHEGSEREREKYVAKRKVFLHRLISVVSRFWSFAAKESEKKKKATNRCFKTENNTQKKIFPFFPNFGA